MLKLSNNQKKTYNREINEKKYLLKIILKKNRLHYSYLRNMNAK